MHKYNYVEILQSHRSFRMTEYYQLSLRA